MIFKYIFSLLCKKVFFFYLCVCVSSTAQYVWMVWWTVHLLINSISYIPSSFVNFQKGRGEWPPRGKDREQEDCSVKWPWFVPHLPWLCLSRAPRSASPRHIFRGHTLIKTFLTWCIIYKSSSVRLLILLCGYRVPMGSVIPLFVAFWPWYL